MMFVKVRADRHINYQTFAGSAPVSLSCPLGFKIVQKEKVFFEKDILECFLYVFWETFKNKIKPKEMNNLTDVSVRRFREALHGREHVGVDDDFCIVNIKGGKYGVRLDYPFRFDGALLIWCIKGNLRISIDLADYDIGDNTLLMCLPGSIFKLKEIEDHASDYHYVCVAMSKEFATSQKADLGKAFSNALSLMDDPRVPIRKEEAQLMADCMDMMGKMAHADIKYRKEGIRAIWASMLYVILGVLDRRDTAGQLPSSRSRMLFEQFMALVAKYHDRYRNVGFYADKLCLTPKYLSKLIKTATGRSAPEWIDAYVILEAKNLLKYSDNTIKEIVYKLNFPNQSVFYKFFKARTGMTPSEYRKS